MKILKDSYRIQGESFEDFGSVRKGHNYINVEFL